MWIQLHFAIGKNGYTHSRKLDHPNERDTNIKRTTRTFKIRSTVSTDVTRNYLTKMLCEKKICTRTHTHTLIHEHISQSVIFKFRLAFTIQIFPSLVPPSIVPSLPVVACSIYLS